MPSNRYREPAIERRGHRPIETKRTRCSLFNIESQVRATIINDQAPEDDTVSSANTLRWAHTRGPENL